MFIAGAAIQWLRDGLRAVTSSDEVEALAASVPDSGGVYLVPAFVGLGAPYWDPDARGALLGLTRGTGLGHIARAAIESIAFQVAEVAAVMDADVGEALEVLRVDGGAARNDSLLQFQADLLGVPVERPVVAETTALGAALARRSRRRRVVRSGRHGRRRSARSTVRADPRSRRTGASDGRLAAGRRPDPGTPVGEHRGGGPRLRTDRPLVHTHADPYSPPVPIRGAGPAVRTA